MINDDIEKLWIAEDEREDIDEELDKVIDKRIRAGNKEAIIALDRLCNFVPDCGFPSNITPAYMPTGEDVKKYKKESGLLDAPLFSEAYLYELFGKEDARTVLALIRHLREALRA